LLRSSPATGFTSSVKQTTRLQVTRKSASVVNFYRSIGFQAFDRVAMRKRITQGDIRK
jgi:hypothetical protein